MHVIDEQKAEIGRMALRDRIASVADVDSVKAVSILEGHCRGMSSDTKVRFLKDQLLYTHDLYAKFVVSLGGISLGAADSHRLGVRTG